ncbi:MAG: hypothetical protein LCI00_02395 [Chloroflexi bacterium]|nr:hypothetical protein [Chloroflexota bacterium]MCC6893559.1 hypothetical protein [Anaerolineae bacterium]
MRFALSSMSKPFASLLPCAFAFDHSFLWVLCASVVNRVCISFLTFDFKLSTIVQQPQRQHTNCTAAVCSRNSAAVVPFQRFAPSLPPPQNVNSADLREHPARHFGGNFAQIANFVP